MQMSEEEIARFKVDDGGPIAVGKFVLRYKGNLIRNTKGEPILFANVADANACIPAFIKAMEDKGIWPDE